MSDSRWTMLVLLLRTLGEFVIAVAVRNPEDREEVYSKWRQTCAVAERAK